MAKKRRKVKTEQVKSVPKRLHTRLPSTVSHAKKKGNKWDAVIFISIVMLVVIPLLVFVIVASNIDSSIEIQILAAFIVLRELYFIIAVWFLAIILYLVWRGSD